MNRYLVLFLALLLSKTAILQDQPKLIVGIVVDQMRADYISRYWDKLGDDGFKRLIREGFDCKNAHFNYIPTYTGPGHASVYTGTTPATHGIIANNWYDRAMEEMVYCVSDEEMKSVGTDTENGKMSPNRMLSPSLGDAVGIHNLFKGKVIGMSIKDRGAILPAGHSADAAYWFDYETGDFISSSYYMNELPKWVNDYNKKRNVDTYVKEGWNTLLPIDQYTESTADDTPYERSVTNSEKPVFPYDLKPAVDEHGYKILTTTPFGNTILRELAQECIKGEQLGTDNITDMLAISFSSTDMVGHMYGPQSIEVEDTYLKLDLELAALLKTLDEKVGKGEYVLFLTADHAAAQVPQFVQDNGMKANYVSNSELLDQMKTFLSERFKLDSAILNYSNQQVFLDMEEIRNAGKRPQMVTEALRDFLMKQEAVANVLTKNELRNLNSADEFTELAERGFHVKRSGDLLVQYLPGWMSYPVGGTTHGTSYNYDTHVPLLFFGKGVNQGVSYDYVTITQIASTICMMSDIALPDDASPKAISEAIKK